MQDLSTDAETVHDFRTTISGPIVLVGHSYGVARVGWWPSWHSVGRETSAGRCAEVTHELARLVEPRARIMLHVQRTNTTDRASEG